MRKLICIILILLSSITQAQIINFPDPVFKNVLVNEEVADLNGNGVFDEDVDTNNDGEIQISEAEAVLGLSIGAYVIESLEGIEYFTNLTFLVCVNNLLTELDVSALVHLEILRCYNNNIENINVNGLTQLTHLYVWENQLESIDISSLQNLRWMLCAWNQLNSINVSGLYNLEVLWAINNNISFIDFTDNILLYWVWLDNNLITSVEVNFLQELEILSVIDNFLTEIEVSNMPSLVELYVGSNDITELDCSTTGTYIIHCENNPNLTSINVQNGVISVYDPDLLNIGFYFYDLPSLEFICIDPGEWNALSNSGYDPENVVVAMGPNCTLSIEDYKDLSITLYPNPVQGILRIQNTNNTEITSIKIYDVLGRLVLVEKGNLNQVEVSHLNSGLLFVKIETDEGVVTKKIIKK